MFDKTPLYRRYRTTHLDHAKPTPSVERFRLTLPTLKKRYGSLLPADRQASILEIGCGNGHFLWFLKELGYRNVRGVDLSPEQVETAQLLGITEASVGDLHEELNRTGQALDLIVARDVLEHFSAEAAIQTLEACRRALRPHGAVLIHLPNGGSPFFGRVRYGDLTHETCYTTRSLAQLFRIAGFERYLSMEDVIAVTDAKSLFRLCAWKVTRLAYRFALFSELGRSEEQVLTQNLIAVAYKAEPGR
jgi:2-polyprenyl-3-methyl-5-hydroxy-6-metoxy-1,4-benzoquinol methylase